MTRKQRRERFERIPANIEVGDYLRITLVSTDKRRGWRYFLLTTPRHQAYVYITATGRMRVGTLES